MEDNNEVTVALIAALASNGVIGKDNALPWRLPEDMKFFKRVTMGKPVVMGRKTYESIGRPLPGRHNIVVSRQRDLDIDGVSVTHTLADAIVLARTAATAKGVSELMIVGGAELYAQALPMAQKMYLTRVLSTVDGDAFFPEVDWSNWNLVWREQHSAGENNPYDYAFEMYGCV